ncbi:SGNH/GDSL hydrolase family protein, partial [Chamaesiphon sp.]|uniref:SGNH/GDSL hydrolase family protein n=1 Tax=Chamaesiphon sp. TaxID=2814140 RepID=UPI003593D68D
MKRFSIACGLIIAASLVPVRAIAATFGQLVVYGDSLSDVGRFFTASTALNNPFPPSPPYDRGRFSNGPVWVEYLATKLGIPNDPSTNFAVGNAKTDSHPQASTPGFIGIKQQIDSDNSIVKSDTLYVIWGGANDYLEPVNPANPADPSVIVGNLTAQIGTLIGRGAKNILVPNLPNLGQLPSTRTLPASGLLDGATQLHNIGLAKSISDLRASNPDVELNLLNVNSLFNTASSAGFNVTDKCITSPSCTPDTYLFWDEVHP